MGPLVDGLGPLGKLLILARKSFTFFSLLAMQYLTDGEQLLARCRSILCL